MKKLEQDRIKLSFLTRLKVLRPLIIFVFTIITVGILLSFFSCSTDKASEKRAEELFESLGSVSFRLSRVSIIRDSKTKCHYILSHGGSALSPRYNEKGKQVCE